MKNYLKIIDLYGMEIQHIYHDKSLLLLFSSLVDAIGVDPKNAGNVAKTYGLQIQRVQGQDGKKKWISGIAAHVLLSHYAKSSRTTPEKAETIRQIDVWIDGMIAGNEGEETRINFGLPDRQPENLPENPAVIPVKTPKKTSPTKPEIPAILPEKSLDRIGESIGAMLGSAAFAYISLIGLAFSMAVIHTQTAILVKPTAHPIGLFILMFIFQMMVVAATVWSGKGMSGWQYMTFLSVFFIFDAGMNACNFFIGFDPEPLFGSVSVTWKDRSQAIVQFAARCLMTAGFPAATLFFAQLAKQIKK